MEHKQTENAIVTNIDEDKGIVEAVWAVMGNIDHGSDIIHPGAFKKTFHERGNQIKLLDNHRSSSVMDSLGVVTEVKELRGGELPQAVMNAFPDATGGAFGKFQFLMDTPEGKGAFARLKAGAIKGWSFGYDAVDKDHTTITKDGESLPVRNLRQIKLYEISPVLFPMNEGAITTDVKKQEDEAEPEAEEIPPAEEETKTESETDAEAEEKAGRVLSTRNAQRIQKAMDLLHQALADAGLIVMEENDKSGPLKSDLTPTSNDDEAGPTPDPYTHLLQLISIELEDLEV